MARFYCIRKEREALGGATHLELFLQRLSAQFEGSGYQPRLWCPRLVNQDEALWSLKLLQLGILREKKKAS